MLLPKRDLFYLLLLFIWPIATSMFFDFKEEKKMKPISSEFER